MPARGRTHTQREAGGGGGGGGTRERKVGVKRTGNKNLNASIMNMLRCTYRSCAQKPQYGVARGIMAEFCSKHAKDGMVNVRPRYASTHVAPNDHHTV